MANSLDRNLKVNDKLVLVGGEIAVVETEGFGCFSFTSGTAIFAKVNGQPMRINGYDIDAKATMERFGKENGWEALPDAGLSKSLVTKIVQGLNS